MSAWVVSDDHIRLLVQADQLYGPILEPDTASDICSMLIRENVYRVNCRYGAGAEQSHAIVYRPVWREEDPLKFKYTVLKAISCYQYQCSEGHDPERSSMWQFCDRLRDLILSSLEVTWQMAWQHPLYDAAPWGYPR